MTGIPIPAAVTVSRPRKLRLEATPEIAVGRSICKGGMPMRMVSPGSGTPAW
ncbi:MAG: hypothetical protein JNM66_10805 [Bryobacterales bacterium]|nr:hypothetical protein [Bryobacterales bacterium]